MGTNSFSVYIKTDDIYKDIAEDVETRFDTPNYELNKALQKWQNKKVIGVKKDEKGGKIMKVFVTLRTKTYSFLIDDGSGDKKGKDKNKICHEGKLKCEDYKTILETNQLEN